MSVSTLISGCHRADKSLRLDSTLPRLDSKVCIRCTIISSVSSQASEQVGAFPPSLKVSLSLESHVAHGFGTGPHLGLATDIACYRFGSLSRSAAAAAAPAVSVSNEFKASHDTSTEIRFYTRAGKS